MFRVLAVDDEVAITEALCDLLTSDDLTLDTAANGKLALEKMRAAPYDVVLLDYMMPVMNGRDTLLAIRDSAVLAQQKIIVMSAFPRAALDLDGLPVYRVLKKPFDIDVLCDLLDGIRREKERPG